MSNSPTTNYTQTKLVMLSTINEDLSLHEEDAVEKLENLFGLTIDKLANGDINLLSLNDMAIAAINKKWIYSK